MVGNPPGLEGYQPLGELGIDLARPSRPSDSDRIAGGVAAGVDWGATLAKLALRRPARPRELRLLRSDDVDGCLRALADARVERLGVTGGGGAALARRFEASAVAVGEFDAWRAGAAELLAELEPTPPARYLLVSLGTGTSVMLVDGTSVERVGGTALGGGTLLGLAAGLIGTSDFERVVELAGRGSRREVDLLVSEVYPDGESPLPGDLIAASFGKLPRRLCAGESIDDADVAHALMGLLAENVARICAGLAAAAQVSRIVFCGSTLRGNAALSGGLAILTRALGREPVFLARGEFAGALGALLLAHGGA
jgi:type II pantothenate kinase